MTAACVHGEVAAITGINVPDDHRGGVGREEIVGPSKSSGSPKAVHR